MYYFAFINTEPLVPCCHPVTFYHVYSAVNFSFYYLEYSVSVNFVISILINSLFQTIYECIGWHRFYLKSTGNPSAASFHCKNVILVICFLFFSQSAFPLNFWELSFWVPLVSDFVESLTKMSNISWITLIYMFSLENFYFWSITFFCTKPTLTLSQRIIFTRESSGFSFTVPSVHLLIKVLSTVLFLQLFTPELFLTTDLILITYMF